jgi:hypothetical protein
MSSPHRKAWGVFLAVAGLGIFLFTLWEIRNHFSSPPREGPARTSPGGGPR